jgi:hypothetical protein
MASLMLKPAPLRGAFVDPDRSPWVPLRGYPRLLTSTAAP